MAQYSAAVIQFVGRAFLVDRLSEHGRRRVLEIANQILTPLAFLALTVLAYKFWA